MEYRRRKAAIPQQTVYAPVPKREEKSDNALSAEVDQKAMANFERRAAKVRMINAHPSTPSNQVYGLGSFAERDSSNIPFGVAPGEDAPCEQFDPAQIAEYKKLQQGSSWKRSWLSCLF